MIWLPYASYPASVISLTYDDLLDTHRGLVLLAKAYNPRQASDEVVPGEWLGEWLGLFFEHQDSFFTFGLYACVQLRARGEAGMAKYQKTWAKYWEGSRKFRRYINHPVWPEGFHQSMRDTLLQRDFEHYSAMFKADDEPFGEVEIAWPRR